MEQQMDTIQMMVEKEQLTLESGGFLASGGGGCWRVAFRFCGTDWQGMTKTAVFIQNTGEGRQTVHLLLDEQDGCMFPSQMLQQPLPVYAGVFGIGGERIRLATNFVRVEVRPGCYGQDLEPEPLPDVYQQVIAKLQQVLEGSRAVLEQAEQSVAKVEGRVDAMLGDQPLANMAEILDLRMGSDGTLYPAAGEAVRSQIKALEDEKLSKNSPGSIGYAMLSQEVREQLTGGNTAVVGKESVLAENLTDGAVTAAKAAFFQRVAGKIDPETNLFDGTFRRIYLAGTTGSLMLSGNENAKLAVVEVQPNTSYSISLNLHTTLKVGSSDRQLADGEMIDGGINVSMGTDANQTLRTTGPNDRYLYISVTNPSADHYDDSEIYLKVIASDKIVMPQTGETYGAFRYVPVGVELYSKDQVDQMIGAIQNHHLLQVEKSGTDLYIRVPCTTPGRYVEHYYKRVDSHKIHMHQWRVQTTNIVDENGVLLHDLDVQTEWEGTLLEKGASDYIGGYHGDEVNTGISVMLDGRLVSLEGEDFVQRCEEVRIVNLSQLSRADTPDLPLFQRVKEQTWNAYAYRIHNQWKALQTVELQEAKLCCISCNYSDSNGMPLIRYARKNDDYAVLDMSEPFSGFGGVDITQMELWAQPQQSGLYLSIQVGASSYPNRHQFITDFRDQNRCKVYFDVTGSHIMQPGELLESDATIRVNY